MNDIVEQQQHLPATQPAGSPFARSGTSLAHRTDLNVGAVAIEQERAIAEAQGKMVLAKRFPRSMANARAEFMEACSDPEFAAFDLLKDEEPAERLVRLLALRR